MLHNCPERRRAGANKKLHPRNSGAFKILKKIGHNAYVLAIPTDLGLNVRFNVEDLTLYKGHDQYSPSEEQEIQLPPSPTPTDKIIDMLDDQIASTRQGVFRSFLLVGRIVLSSMPHGLQLQISSILILISKSDIGPLNHRSRIFSSRGVDVA